MPFIDGRYYMNPAYGRALQRARAAEAASQLHETDQQEPGAHWVTIDGRHVLIQETQARRARHKLSSTTLNLGGRKVDVTFSAIETNTGNRGVTIDAKPQGCGDCRWAQTTTKTGEHGHGPRTDRELPSQPLYPTTERMNGFHDEPSTPKGESGTFTAVTTLGVADQETKTFEVLGSMTWGYKIDKGGNVAPMGPRVATRGEQAGSVAVLKRDSPGWTIGP